MNKETEKKRLAKEVFEGMSGKGYKDFDFVHMQENGVWWISNTPVQPKNKRWMPSRFIEMESIRCRNQPKTALNWTETLLRREDYE